MRSRVLAPAGTVIPAAELAAALAEALRPGDAPARLAAALRERYDIPHVFLVSSARAGMTVLLRALGADGPGRAEVAMPGYTCYSVAASAVRAGLCVRPLDVDPRTLDIAPEALRIAPLGQALALVGTSLYGLPSDLPALEAAARLGGAAFIDDAAQCLDGRIAGRWVGSFGDAGLFSFDKGKNVTSIQGGAIVCRDAALAERLSRAHAALSAPPASAALSLLAKMVAYTALLRPWLYGIPNALLTLGETPFELDAPMTRLAPSLAPIVRRQLARLGAITEGRRARAAQYAEALAGERAVAIPARPADVTSVHPRLALVLDSPERRDRVLLALRRAGLGATASYPRALRDVPEIEPHLAPGTADTPGARAVAARILTLPTHGYVTHADIARAVRIIRGT